MGSGISKEVLPERLDEESFMAVSKIMLSDIFHKKKDKDGHLTKEQVLDFLKALSIFTTGDFPSSNFERKETPPQILVAEDKAQDSKEVIYQYILNCIVCTEVIVELILLLQTVNVVFFCFFS